MATPRSKHRAYLDDPRGLIEHDGKLERDTSTPEKRTWWDEVKRAAENPPRLNMEDDDWIHDLRGLEPGIKHDEGKPQLSFLGQVSRALADVARSLAHGAKKYSPDNWRRLPDGSRRYRDAALRHLFADLRGERIDPEQQLPHVTIAALNLLLAAEHDLGFDDDDDGDDARQIPLPFGPPPHP